MATDTATEHPEETIGAQTGTPVKIETSSTHRSLIGWFGMPVFLILILGATYIWIQGRELDSIEQRVLNQRVLTEKLVEHLQLVAVSTAIVIAIAIPLGVILTRPFARRAVPITLAIANGGQAIPSLGLITIVVIWMGIGFTPVIIGLVAYSALPILRNTMVGLQQVDHSFIKASRGMGLSPMQVLMQVELPLAIPVMIAGIRTALVINVGTATLATFFGAGGLGFVIFQGIGLNRDPVLITGVVMASGLALLVDYLAGVAGHFLSPRGL
ncbi:ABC transporter permease [Nocardioides donggukensis]|uniref:ABC transporter permease n=1 Tax=Nocardioides donggukensis TaxID=2774019 RepID=A0A927Q1S4_9ACTN|nr:ABC transporter permease [Nocardioides donggukensis]MBD8870452.1 ABC transporter permease [Nocardioides donggukensis]